MTYQDFGEIVGRTTVSISSLNNTNLDGIDTSFMNKFSNEKGSKTSNLVTIQKSECTFLSHIIKHDTIGITIEWTTSISSRNRNTRRSTLLSLYKISTTLNKVFGQLAGEKKDWHEISWFALLTFLFNWPNEVVFSFTISTDKISEEMCWVISRSLGAPTPLAQSTCNVDKRGFPFYL